jgi:hypothetical protein
MRSSSSPIPRRNGSCWRSSSPTSRRSSPAPSSSAAYSSGATARSGASISPIWRAPACAGWCSSARCISSGRRTSSPRRSRCGSPPASPGRSGRAVRVRSCRSCSSPPSPSAAISWSLRSSAGAGSRSTTSRASPMRASSPTSSASTRASRRSATSRSIRVPTCTSRRACPTMRASTCRACRPTPIWRCISTATGRSGSSAICRPGTPPISVFCRCIIPTSSRRIRRRSSRSSAAGSRPRWRCVRARAA